MNEDLYARLRRLGVTRGARQLRPMAKPSSWSGDAGASPAAMPSSRGGAGEWRLEQLLPGGVLQETGQGACFVRDQVYPLSFQHGRWPLAQIVRHTPAAVMSYVGDERLRELQFRDFLFVDTETTGLAGAGTVAFLVGVAFFEQAQGGDVFVVRQYFLRDHADELAMLSLLSELTDQKAGLITFNGRAFDLPLLDARYLMNRLPGALLDLPHLDLLQAARRLWRQRLGSVALGALEREILAVRRSEEDVPGWLIPTLYNNYLRSGDASELRRVFYHNQVDMLSMVTLACEIFRQFEPDEEMIDPIDRFSLAKWQIDAGDWAGAEENLRRAVAADLPLELYHQALRLLGQLLKRAGRREEAVPIWKQWAATSLDSTEAYVELAKHYEWHERDRQQALQWTMRALELVARWPVALQKREQKELEHRLARLQRCLEQEAG